jgi:hypothetical protein
MSYSGYTEYLCENGHYHTADDNYGCNVLPKCLCGEKMTHYKVVDTTNGYANERFFHQDDSDDDTLNLACRSLW